MGFSPEILWATEAGKSKLNERLAIRPTSETVIYPLYSRWIRSWKDLPLRINQWCNVVRWEKADPRIFLRGKEFLWQEGHTVFATKQEAEKEADIILSIYKAINEEYLAIPCTIGRKTEKEKFAGAVYSMSIEHLMPDGKGIQGPDFHFDGQNFSQTFGITFLDKDGKKQYAWQNTWGLSTRQIGVMLATHGDDKGVIIPPRIAPIQVVIIPIFKEENKDIVMKKSEEVRRLLEQNQVLVKLDRSDHTPGFKFNHWEVKGVPLRIEIGPKDVDKKQVTFARRDTGEKREVTDRDIISETITQLGSIQRNLFERAKDFLIEHTKEVRTYEEFKKYVSGNRILACWCGDQDCEEKIKEETGAKTFCIPRKEHEIFSPCIYCGKRATHVVYFGKSY